MDGGGRLLRSLGGFGARGASTSLALASGPLDPFSFPVLPQAVPKLPRRMRRKARGDTTLIKRIAATRLLGTALVLGFLGTVGMFGALRGGEYADFVKANGTVADVLGRAAGLSIKAVTITGLRELTEAEVLKLAQVGPTNSLASLDVAEVRRRLKAVALIKDASVSKLYPNRLLIEIQERQPFALWQKDGALFLVASDGTPIDDMHDPRFQRLPLVVGEGANNHLAEYYAVLDASGELRDRIKAGIFVAERRWTLKTDGGIDIELPEQDPAAAIARLARLEHDDRILEKDVLSLDLRIADRVVVRLTAGAAAARSEALAKKTGTRKGAAT